MLATMSAKLSAETLAYSNDKLSMEIYRQSRISQSESKLVGVNLFPNG